MEQNRFPAFPRNVKWGEKYGGAMKVTTAEEAKDYFERCVEHTMSFGRERREAEQIEKSNIGYWTGYYDAETACRVMALFECCHPIFGTSRPDEKTAFELGKRIGEQGFGE